ncbi:MAG TPA: hypothetical protein VLA75_07695 [Thermoanaerobaculia bacterium]|nr:hypothetical protein [Thermoanaerobaculia bacterium]
MNGTKAEGRKRTGGLPGLAAIFSLALASAVAAGAEDSCSATGVMAGEAFSASHCAAAVLPGENSVTIWFNESPIADAEHEMFAMSAYASSIHEGKERTMLLVAFCPGGGGTTASAEAVKSFDVGLAHASSPLAGAQWVMEAPKELRVERIEGEAVPGGRLAGRIVGGRTSDGRPYRLDLTFDLALPKQEAASGIACGR